MIALEIHKRQRIELLVFAGMGEEKDIMLRKWLEDGSPRHQNRNPLDNACKQTWVSGLGPLQSECLQDNVVMQYGFPDYAKGFLSWDKVLYTLPNLP